jgi:hypothetical protein
LCAFTCAAAFAPFIAVYFPSFVLAAFICAAVCVPFIPDEFPSFASASFHHLQLLVFMLIVSVLLLL